MKYSEKLKDPRWQKKRLEIFERDEWKCVNCNSSRDTLHVHHKSYSLNTDPWDYHNDTLVTLCDMCHGFEHAKVNCDGCGVHSILYKHGSTNLCLHCSCAKLELEPWRE